MMGNHVIYAFVQGRHDGLIFTKACLHWKSERWVKWMWTVSKTAGKLFVYHCNDVSWRAWGCISCSTWYTTAKNTQFMRHTLGSTVRGNHQLSPGSINSNNTLPLLPDSGHDACCFILSNSSVTYGNGHIPLWIIGLNGWGFTFEP